MQRSLKVIAINNASMKNIIYEYPSRKLSREQQIAVDNFKQELGKGIYVLENTDCLICFKSDSKLLYTNDRYGIPVKTVSCRNCGFIYTNPRMNEESTNKFYESDIYRKIYGGIENSLKTYLSRYQYNSKIKFNVDVYSANESFFLFLKELDIHYETVCEIGAGGGWNLVPFIKTGKKTIGYEPSQFLCNIGNEKGINLKRGFLRDVRGSFDLVILRHVLEHFIDPLPALEKIRKYTRRYLAIEVPGIVDKIPSIQNAHTMYFSLNTLPKMLSVAGFRMCHIEYFRSNNFIIALFEKANNYNRYYYDYRKEVSSMIKLYYCDRGRYLLSRAIKTAGLYSLIKR